MSSHDQSLSTFGQDLIKAAQDNPIPAALIGMGVLWWFSGGSQTSLSGADLSGAASSALQGMSRVARQATDVGKSAVDAATETAGATGQQLADTSSSILSGASETFNAAADSAQRYGFAMQRDLADLLERRPLALGAIGLCLGAVVASAIPVTDAEKEMFGETSDAVKEQAKSLVTDGMDTASDIAETVKRAAQSEGVGAGDAAAVGKSALKKAEAVATKAVSAAENKISKL